MGFSRQEYAGLTLVDVDVRNGQATAKANGRVIDVRRLIIG